MMEMFTTFDVLSKNKDLIDNTIGGKNDKFYRTHDSGCQTGHRPV